MRRGQVDQLREFIAAAVRDAVDDVKASVLSLEARVEQLETDRREGAAFASLMNLPQPGGSE